MVQFTDLRGTAVTRLAIAGCTIPEIASISGHTHAEVVGGTLQLKKKLADEAL